MTPSRHRQRGWAGLIVILLALVIVAMLGQTLLRQMGLVPGGSSPSTSTPGARQPGAALGAAPIDNSGATPAPAQAVDRTRNLGQTLQREAEDLDRKLGDK